MDKNQFVLKNMDKYKQEIIDEISAAPKDKVKEIVEASLKRLRQNKINEYLIQRYNNKMLQALLEIKENRTPPDAGQNIDTAIEVFKKHIDLNANK